MFAYFSTGRCSISFIHSGHFYSVKSSTTQRRSRLQHEYCNGVSCQSAQATVGKELAQGPYVVASAGVAPTTIRLKVIDSTNASHAQRSPHRVLLTQQIPSSLCIKPCLWFQWCMLWQHSLRFC